MCSPHLSFLMDKNKKIYYKDRVQSHSDLADFFGLNEDKLLKVDYDWTSRTMDVIGDNEEQNKGCFMPMPLHYITAENFIKEKVGTKKKLMEWLSKNKNDSKIKKEAVKILNVVGQKLYLTKKNQLDLRILFNLFEKHPNEAWSV